MILYDCCTLSSMFASQQKAFANWHFSRNPGGRNRTWQQTCSTWLAPLIELKKHFALFPFAWYTSSQKTSEGADEQVCREADKLCWQAHLRFVVHKAHWYSCHLLSLFLPHYDYRRKFRSQTSDNMDRCKAEQGRGREKRKIRRKKSRRERVRRKKMQMREKVGKSRNAVFFQWFVAPEGRKVGSLKRRVRSQLARWEMKNCTPLWREAHFQVKTHKTHHGRTTFGSWDVEKVHAVVARSTFPSQNAQNTPASDHFWKLRCRKSARRCGARHISKSKCTKHTSSGPLLAVEMSKKCAPLWREAHLEVKMLKTLGVRTTFGSSDLEKVHAVVARSTFWSQNVKNTRGSVPLLEAQMSFRFASLHYTTLHYTTLHYTTLHYTTHHNTTITTTQLHSTTLHYAPLRSTTLNYTTLHNITLHYTPLHYTTLHYTTLHYTTLHSTTLQLQLHNYTPLHSTTLHYTKFNSTTLHSTKLHYTTLHYTTFHYTSLHSTTLHYTTLRHSTTTTTQLHSTTLHYTPLHSTTLHSTTLHYTPLHSTALHCTPLHSTALH